MDETKLEAKISELLAQISMSLCTYPTAMRKLAQWIIKEMSENEHAP